MTCWIIMGHPLQLPLALCLALPAPPAFSFHLVISRHKYWKYINIEEYRQYFKSITWFEPIPYAHTLAEIVKTVRALHRTQQAMRALPIKKDDVLISLEAWDYVENCMTTVWRRNRQIFLCPEGIFPFVSKSLSAIRKSKRFFVAKSGYIHYLFLEPLLRLKKRTLFYWERSAHNNHGIAYSLPITTLYNTVLVLTSVYTPQLAENNVYYPYPLLRDLLPSSAAAKRIVFFLSGYLKSDHYYEYQNKILASLKQQYQPKGVLLEIRLHPNDPDEYKKVNADGWAINREPGNAEQYLIRHANDIVAAFSHVSTSLLFALNFGIPSYSYHRIMGFEPEYAAWYDSVYAAAPKEFFMSEFNARPQTYDPPADLYAKAKQSVQSIYALIAPSV